MNGDELEDLLQQALDGVIECPECGLLIEPDCPECSCGWKNPLVKLGMI